MTIAESTPSLVTEVRTGGPLVWCASLVGPSRSGRPADRSVAGVGGAAPGPSDGHVQLVDAAFRPPHAVLLDAERGPFASCTRGQHQDGKPGPLPLVTPAENWATSLLR